MSWGKKFNKACQSASVIGTSEECAAKYQRFCQRYPPQAKLEKKTSGVVLFTFDIERYKVKKVVTRTDAHPLGQTDGDGKY